jgi:hypothetical protein
MAEVLTDRKSFCVIFWTKPGWSNQKKTAFPLPFLTNKSLILTSPNLRKTGYPPAEKPDSPYSIQRPKEKVNKVGFQGDQNATKVEDVK